MSKAAAVEIRGLVKNYGGVAALRGVDFTLREGEIHALMGQNGAGKSTLIRILAGAEKAVSGCMEIFGTEKQFNSPADASEAGVSVVYQDLSLIPEMTVADNLFLGREPVGFGGFVKKSEIKRRVTKVLEDYKFPIDPRARVQDLSFAYKQMTEIAKALLADAKILVLDEPTSALTDGEEDILFAAIRNVVSRGVSVVYVTHRLDEVFRICERVTVFRDGSNVGTYDVASLDMKTLVSSIIGSKASSTQGTRSIGGNAKAPRNGKRFSDQPFAIEMRNVTNQRVRSVNLAVGRGEIVGLAGPLGSGRTELLETIFGVRRLDSGQLLVDGVVRTFRDPADAISAGIGLVPEDRHQEGLVLSHSIEMNIALPWIHRLTRAGYFLKSQSLKRAESAISEVSIKASSPSVVIATLSGGNQQKVVFGKWGAPRCKLLLLDEPTVGVDIGARAEIYAEIRKAAEQGTAVIVVSSDFAELTQICDRYYVVQDGTVSAELKSDEIATEEDLHHRVHVSSSVREVVL